MLRKLAERKAQSTLEYAILIGVIVAGLIGMQVYLKRGWQGKLKESADSMGQQFSPGQTTTNYTTHSYTNSAEALANEATTTTIHTQTTNRTGSENVAGANKEYWFGGD